MEKVNTMELTTYTYRSLADLLQAMFEVSELKGVKFSLQISKNISLIKEEFAVDNLQIETKEVKLKDIISLSKIFQNSSKLFILPPFFGAE